MKKRTRCICALLVVMTSMNMLPGADAVRTTARENRALRNRLSSGESMPLTRKERPFAVSYLWDLLKSSGTYSAFLTEKNLFLSQNLIESGSTDGILVTLVNAQENLRQKSLSAPVVTAEPTPTPQPTAAADGGLSGMASSESTTSPQETSAPEGTVNPQATPTPEATANSQETSAPEETADPQETPAPEETADPQETPAPEETADPQETLSPEETADPQETLSPEETADPQETLSPEETPAPGDTVKPEDILNPEGTENGDSPAVPEATLLPEELEEVQDSEGTTTVVIKKSYPSAWYGKVPTDGQGMPIPILLQGQYKQPVCIRDGTVRSVATSGCGATSVSMVVAYLTGNIEQTPYTLFKLAMERDHYCGSGLNHQTLSMLAAEYGVHTRWIANDAKSIIDALNAGKPVIAHMGPGVFTKEGHYIVLRGLTDDGLIVVNDPASAYRTGRAYPIDVFLQQARMNDCFMVCWVDEMPGSDWDENCRDRIAAEIPLVYVEPDGGIIEPEDEAADSEGEVTEPEGAETEEQTEVCEEDAVDAQAQIEADEAPVKDKRAKSVPLEMVIEEIEAPAEEDADAAAESENAAAGTDVPMLEKAAKKTIEPRSTQPKVVDELLDTAKSDAAATPKDAGRIR